MEKYSEKYDVVIIGSGIAGMSAGIYLKRNNMSVLIIENNTPGGELNRSSVIENYPGYSSIDGPTLAYNIYNQVNNLEIDHNLGDIKYKKLLGKTYVVSNHNHIRRYYIMRNNHYIFDNLHFYDYIYYLQKYYYL